MWLLPSNGLVYRVVDFVGGDDGDGCVFDFGCGYYPQMVWYIPWLILLVGDDVDG